MITMYVLGLLSLILNALCLQRSSPMALMLCMEMLALTNIILWLIYLNSSLPLAAMAISFWMMFFIIMGATMGLVLLSIISTSFPQSSKMIN